MLTTELFPDTRIQKADLRYCWLEACNAVFIWKSCVQKRKSRMKKKKQCLEIHKTPVRLFELCVLPSLARVVSPDEFHVFSTPGISTWPDEVFWRTFHLYVCFLTITPISNIAKFNHVLQGDFFNWASPEFAKCWPVSNWFQKNIRVRYWPPIGIENV